MHLLIYLLEFLFMNCRALALKALDMRLSKAPTSSSGGSNSEPAPPMSRPLTADNVLFDADETSTSETTNNVKN